MFFTPRIYEKKSHKKITFAGDARINSDFELNDALNLEIKKITLENNMQDDSVLCNEIHIHSSMDEAKEMIKSYGEEYCPNSEGYAILTGEKTHIWAEGGAAVTFALATIRQMSDFGELTEGFVYDYPRSSYRGYRIYVPGRDHIDDLKRTIDLLSYYKYNTLMIQVGGAMEYKRHPEINTTWEKYCDYLTEFPYRVSYHRNKWNYLTCGVHPDAGDGSYITQEEMKDIVAYCKERNIDVVPEVPSLSHCDYLTMAHPEIRELARAHGCADGYCPSNPKSYELLFDVIDEIIEVFEPKYINIAHDESCQIHACEKCREKSPAQLFSDDVTKIHDYLSTKGIKTMMWADAMAKPMRNGKEVYGRGTGFNKKGDWDYIPPTNECCSMLPKDIIIINWLYFGSYRNTEDIVRENGYEMVYGNMGLETECVKDWNERTQSLGIPGGLISNWGSNEIYYARKNYSLFELIRSAYMFWSKFFDESKYDELYDAFCMENYRYFTKYLSTECKNAIEITHTTDLKMPFRFYFSGHKVNMDNLTIGNYIIMYDDGTCAKLPVIYGDNISNQNPDKILLKEISCCAQIVKDGKTYYKYRYENPYPDKNILSVSFLKKKAADFSVYIKEIRL